jgi:uncharacterized protein YecE (DUF72 family)
MGNILVGTCGYSYSDWVGVVYGDLRDALSEYIKVFPLVEVDSTFYRYPSNTMVRSWLRKGLGSITVSMKIPRVITHEKQLDLKQGVEEDLGRFMSIVEPLIRSNSLKVLLIQLPPYMRRNLIRLEDFLNSLSNEVNWAVEFRDRSWLVEDTFRLLERYGAIYVIVDEPLLPPITRITGDLAYIRFHGHGEGTWYNYLYSTEELMKWVPRITRISGEVPTYLLFNNHPGGRAVLNALQMMRLLGLDISPRGLELMSRLESRFHSSTLSSP